MKNSHLMVVLFLRFKGSFMEEKLYSPNFIVNIYTFCNTIKSCEEERE